MKNRLGFVTNSSSASFIIGTNLNSEDMLEKIFNLDISIDEKHTFKSLLGDESKLLPALEMSSCILKILDTIIPLDVDDYSYLEKSWMDESTGNVRYRHIFVYKVEQMTNEWSVLFELLDKLKGDKEIFIHHCYWD